MLPHLLRPHGYYTANIGKLHFLPHANRDHRWPHPAYGFDHLEVSDEPGSMKTLTGPGYAGRLPNNSTG
jgi:arylsulfatase A-like enzyme